MPQPAHASSHDITGFSATPGSANNATLSWTAPSRSGITVDRYEIYWTPSSMRDLYLALGNAPGSDPAAVNGFVWPLRGSAWLGGSATSYTVTGLYGGIDYDFTIIAKGSGFNTYDSNRNVVDQTNNTGEFQFVEDIAIAGPPHPFRSIDLTPDDGQIRAGWWLPRATKIGSSITKAQLQYKESTSTNWITINYSNYAAWFPYPATPQPGSVEHSRTIGLNPGTYNVRIRAGNSGGWSAYTQATATVPANPPTSVTVASSGTLREGGSPVAVTFTLDHPAHRELRAEEAYVVLGDDRVNVSTPRFARGSRTATATIAPINDNISNPCGSVAIKYLFSSGLRATVSFTIIDDDSATNRCTGRIGDGTPSALRLERVELIEDGAWLRAYVLAKLNRPALDTRIVNVVVDGSSTATEGPYDWNGPNDFQVNGNGRLHILRGNVNARYTDNRGTHDWPTEVIINEDASDHETIVLRATSGSLTSNTLTLRVGELRRQAALQGADGGDAPPTAVTLALGDGDAAADELTVDEKAGEVTITATLNAPAPDGGVSIRLHTSPDDTATRYVDYTLPETIAIPAGERSGTGVLAVVDDALDETDETVNIVAVASLFDADLTGKAALTITDDDPCANCGTEGDLGVLPPPDSDDEQEEQTPQEKYADLIAKMKEWRNDPRYVHDKAHTDRWDRALLAFGETVADTTLTRMTADEAQGYADRGWERWVDVAAALRELESGGQQEPTNQSPTVSAAIGDATIVNESGTKQVSLSGVFSDADNDSLTVTAASSDEAVATVSVASDYSSLTVTAKARGSATITVTANDGNGGTISDAFTVKVKAAPVVVSALADVSLEEGATQDVSLSGVFSDADGDALTLTVTSSDEAVDAYEFHGELTIVGVSAGSATVTVTAQDSDGDRVSDAFDVSVAAGRPQQEQAPPPNQAPTVSSALSNATIVSQSGTHWVSLSGVFSDADSDPLTVTAASDDNAIATVSVTSDYSSLTVSAQSRGTAAVTVTADDGNGGTVSDSFTVTVKSAPVVAYALADLTGLEAGATQEVSLAGVFNDADGDSLTITAASSADAKATVTVAADQSKLTVAAVAEGTVTITVTARDSDGNQVSQDFDVTVPAPQEPEPETTDVVARYDFNGDGKIDRSEYEQARQDYEDGKITALELWKVRKAYESSR